MSILDKHIELKQSTSLYIKPFKPLASYSSLLRQIEHLISLKEYETAMKLSEQLRSLALQGLHYFQTYDWLMLMTVITLGYVGWMIYVILHVLQSYTSLPATIFRKEQVPNPISTVKVPVFLYMRVYVLVRGGLQKEGSKEIICLFDVESIYMSRKKGGN